MIVNILQSRDRKIVVIIDSELLGKKVEEGNKQLDLTSDFYKGEEKTTEEIKNIVRGAYILHLVGSESVALASKMKWIDESNVIRIKGIPHAETVIV